MCHWAGIVYYYYSYQDVYIEKEHWWRKVTTNLKSVGGDLGAKVVPVVIAKSMSCSLNSLV